MDDDEVERYLDRMDAYSTAKARAGRAWREAFIRLVQARLAGPLIAAAPERSAATVFDVASGRLHEDAAAQRRVLVAAAGAFPPASARSAQAAFLDALRSELEAAEHEKSTRKA